MLKTILLPLLLLSLTSCNGELLGEPKVLFTFNLDAETPRTLSKGNAVVASQDSIHIFATASDGSLHIINRNNVSPPITTVFEPAAVAGTDTKCNSGMIVLNDDGEYVLYAVVNGNDSRLFAVDVTGDLIWKVDVEGKIVGTPVVYEDKIYVSRKVDDETGYLSVFFMNGKSSPPELAASLTPADGSAPLGPPALSETGVVAVAESWDDGYREEGSIHLLLPSERYDELGGQGNEAYQMILASSWPFSAVTKPVIAGGAIWLGATGANLAGWQQKDIANVLAGKKQNINPKWTVQLPTSQSDASQPLVTNPVVSSDLASLVVPGTNGELYCMQGKDGKALWTDSATDSPILAEPVVDGDFVYVIESSDGIVRQHSIGDGERTWTLDCTQSDACKGNVEADFSLSPNKNVVYYGDVDGNIVALTVAAFETDPPTLSPTVAPTTTAAPTVTASPTKTVTVPTAPTASPVNGEVRWPTDGGQGLQDGERSPGFKGVVAGSIVGAILVLCAVCFLFFLVAKRRKEKEDKEKEKQNFEQFFSDEDDSDSLDDIDLEDGESHNVADHVSVLAAGDEVEIGYDSPEKKSAMALADTPETLPEDDEEDNTVVLVDGDSPPKDLGVAFSLVAEAQTDKDAYNRDSDSESGNSVPPPPPPPPPLPSNTEEEEKKEEHEPVDQNNDIDHAKSDVTPQAANIAPLLPDVFHKMDGKETPKTYAPDPIGPDDESQPDDERMAAPGSHYMNGQGKQGETWSNFLNDLAEAEKEFFEPGFNKGKSGDRSENSSISYSLEGGSAALGSEQSI